jgi:hypothetical protein
MTPTTDSFLNGRVLRPACKALSTTKEKNMKGFSYTCKLGHEAVDFQAVILARVFLLLWLRKRNFSENDQGKDPLINRVITKKSTASCQNLQ